MARCTARTRTGARCKRTATQGTDLCSTHAGRSIEVEFPGSELARQQQHEDMAWAMWMRGANYSQIARTLEVDGVRPYSDGTPVKRALERAFTRHEVVTEAREQRTKQDHILNDMLQRLYRELQELQQPLVGEAMVLAKQEGVPAEEAVRIVANAMEMDARRQPRVLQTVKEIRNVVTQMGRIWGTDRHAQKHEVSVFSSAPLNLAALTAEERRRLLLAIAADAERRAAIPVESREG
jgi:hypothetical protein